MRDLCHLQHSDGRAESVLDIKKSFTDSMRSDPAAEVLRGGFPDHGVHLTEVNLMVPVTDDERLRASCGGGDAGHLLQRTGDMLGCDAGSDESGLQRSLSAHRASGVLSAMLLVHSSQVPCSREEVLHRALRGVVC